MSIVGDVRNPSQSGILNGTSKGECWLSDDNMLAVTYSYPVGGCGVFGKIKSTEKAKIYFDKVFGYLKVSAKCSCGFSNTLISSIIAGERYLDYFTTITEERLWQLLAKPVFRWRNSSGLSMNVAKAA